MLLYFTNPKPTRKKLQRDREGTIGNSLGNQDNTYSEGNSPSFEMVESLQRPVIQTNEMEITTRGIWLRNRVQERKRKRSSRCPFKNVHHPQGSRTRPICKNRRNKQSWRILRRVQALERCPTNGHTVCEKTTDQNTYNWIQKSGDYLMKKHGEIK